MSIVKPSERGLGPTDMQGRGGELDGDLTGTAQALQQGDVPDPAPVKDKVCV